MTLLFALWLLGAEPCESWTAPDGLSGFQCGSVWLGAEPQSIEILGTGEPLHQWRTLGVIDPVPTIQRMVGPFVTEEKCLYTKPPNDLVAHWGRKVCMQMVVEREDPECSGGICMTGGPRWCWCAKEESK